MKQITFTEALHATFAQAERPQCHSDHVMVRMIQVGVCGTDIQVFAGRNRYMQFPVVPFHEGVGEVVEVGSGVENIHRGDLVSIRPILSCGVCYSCKRGRENACMNFNCLGVQSDGLGSEYVVLPKEYIYVLPSDCELDVAVLIEPFAVGVHAAKRVDPKGKRVLVVGAGTIGNFVAQACQLFGSSEVTICDVSDDKLAMARSSNIGRTISNANMSLKEMVESEFESFPDLVIDCVGGHGIFNQILEFAGKTTDIVVVGNYSEPLSVDVASIQRNELTVLGSITYTARDFQEAVDLMVAKKVHTDGFITNRFAVEDVQRMMETSLETRGLGMKTVMDF